MLSIEESQDTELGTFYNCQYFEFTTNAQMMLWASKIEEARDKLSRV